MTAHKDAWQDTEAHHPVEDDPRWREEAACRGISTALFFPARGELIEEAKAVCRGCPVQVDCLEYALSQRYMTSGVWGATSERDRRKMRVTRRVA